MITTPIPLFPLGLVLLPGAAVPLHIFEPRYRAMLRDVSAGNRIFGLITLPPGASEAELPTGRIGCTALVTAVDMLADGRVNIMIEGVDRFRFETYVDGGTPYRIGHIAPYDDTADDATELARAGAALRDLATRAIRASMSIHDVASESTEFDSDDAALSFQVAHLLHLEPETLYTLLSERSPLARLHRLDAALRTGLDTVEGSAELHARAKTNGHHHGPPPPAA